MKEKQKKVEKFRKPFTQKRVTANEPQASMTDQSQKDACCINKILATYDKTGILTHVNRFSPMYDDVSDIGTYEEALMRVNNTQAAFDGLPSDVRQRFMHDPKKFIEFITDEKNFDECVDMGLLEAPKKKNAVDVAAEKNKPSDEAVKPKE